MKTTKTVIFRTLSKENDFVVLDPNNFDDIGRADMSLSHFDRIEVCADDNKILFAVPCLPRILTGEFKNCYLERV